jgi:glutathione peroxidase
MNKEFKLCANTAFAASVLTLLIATSGLPSWAATPVAATSPTMATATKCPALLQRDIPRLQDEKPQSLCQYAGKVIVVVNTASFCGFTSQYKGLETLHKRYRDRGLVVLGFPSNDFGAQEPGSNKDIAAFCENTFDVKFPMFMKTRVAASSGTALSPLYADLKQLSGASPKWNFHKYVIARDGHTVLSFASEVEPTGTAFTKPLEQLLDAK